MLIAIGAAFPTVGQNGAAPSKAGAFPLSTNGPSLVDVAHGEQILKCGIAVLVKLTQMLADITHVTLAPLAQVHSGSPRSARLQIPTRAVRVVPARQPKRPTNLGTE